MANNVGWFFESGVSAEKRLEATPKTTFGGFTESGIQSFDDHFKELQEHYKESTGIDIMKDIKPMLSDRQFMESYKADLMGPVFEAFKAASPNDPHVQAVIENVSQFWDTKVRSYTESASMTGYLPIATLEFPVLVKQFFRSIIKDIIEVEATKTPNIAKHIRTTYMVDDATGKEYEYPRCLFDGTWQKIWEAQKGIKINNATKVPLTNGRVYKYDVITNLTTGTAGVDKLSFAFKINAINIGTNRYTIPGNGITLEFSTGGTFVNGDLDFTAPDGTVIADTISGKVNFKAGTVDISSASGQVDGVYIEGYLSNEKNLRHASVREKRDILRFTIEDGARWNMPFSIEEIEDAAALLDLNYYNRMVDEIVKCQETNEGLTVIKFLNDEFAKYNGVAPNIYKLESLATVYSVNIQPPASFAGDPFKYVSSSIQFRLRSVIHQITDTLKLDGLSFIIVGNPMATQLISEFTNWKTVTGSTVGGIQVNNSYGFATDLGANVRVVATNMYDAYTKDPWTPTTKRELVLHIYGYPTTNEHISFRHLKYTSHLLTSQNQTAYQSTNAPGGAYNIVTATSRFKDICVQGIQARLILEHSETVYGTAPAAAGIGAPWA